MRRTVLLPSLLLTALAAAPQAASADLLIGGNFGGFIPRGFEGRKTGDVIAENLTFRTYLDDDFDQDPVHKLFTSVTFGGEVLFGLGDFVEAGVGINYFQSPEQESFYTDFTDVDGSDIFQTTQFKVVPLAVTARVFPIGRTTPVQPYVGGGVVFYHWNYKEDGEFIDFSDPDLPIFPGDFEDDGNAVGGTFLAGVRFPIGHRFLVGGEWRWQNGSADLAPELNFAGDKLDLGGNSVVATFHFKF
jgi:opacity protein-like surface antigen